MSTGKTGFPAINPVGALALFLVVPAVCLLPLRRKIHEKRKPTWNASSRIMKGIFNLAHLVIKAAPVIALGNIFWMGLLTINQAAFLFNNLTWQKSLSYYTNVDLVGFETMEMIQNAQVRYSYNTQQWIESSGVIRSRRLQGTEVGSSITLAYHTDNWENLLNSTTLATICQTEKKIRENDCFSGQSYASFLPQIFSDGNCTISQNFTTSLARVGLVDNRRYVADNTTEDNLYSPVLLTYYDGYDCPSASPKSLYNLLNSLSTDDHIKISYTDKDLNRNDFSNLTYSSVSMLIAAGIVTYILLVAGARGFYVPFVTLLCVLFSLINAAAMLPLFGYRGFSVYNGAGAFIVMAYAGSSIMTFAASWRKIVRLNTRAAPKDIVATYQTAGQTIAYVTFVSQFCFYSLTASPVAFMQQFGIFTGLAIASYWLAFHYVVVPNWVLASKFLIPKRVYKDWRQWKKDHCSCIKQIDEALMADGWATAMMNPNGDADDSDYDEENEEEDDEYTEGGRGRRRRTNKKNKRRGDGEYEDEEDEEETIVADVQVIQPPQSHMDPFRAGDTQSVVSQAIPIEDADETKNEDDEDEDEGGSANKRPRGDGGNEEEEDEDEGYWSKGKRPLKVFGLLMFLGVIVGLIIVYVISLPVANLNLGIPQQMDSGTNLGQQLHIFKHYKSDLFLEKIPQGVTVKTSQPPTRAPTRLPTRVPTRRPTRFPTMLPTTGSATTEVPTMSVETPYVDFTVLTCWGLRPDRHGKDGTSYAKVDYNGFLRYARNTDGILTDIQTFCAHVESDRTYLDLSPTWTSADCLYNQYIEQTNFLPSTGSSSFNTPAYKWSAVAQTSYTAGSLIGLSSNTTDGTANPVYVCGNFSVRTYVDGIEDHPSAIEKVRSRWEKAFWENGVARAKAYGVPYSTSSAAFTYPLLDQWHVDNAMDRFLALPLVFLGFLLWMFTLADFGLTLFGSLGMFTILSVMVCLHIFFVSSDLDLIDVMLISGILTIIVDFPAHLIVEYMASRAFVDRQKVLNTAKSRSPALAQTNKYVRHAIVFPTCLFVFMAIPMLFADFVIYRRVGSYLIIAALLSFVFAAFLQPYLLAFGCRTRILEQLCLVKEEEVEDDSEDNNSDNRSGSVDEEESEYVSEEARSEYTQSVVSGMPPPAPMIYAAPSMYQQPVQPLQPMMSMYAPPQPPMMMVAGRGPAMMPMNQQQQMQMSQYNMAQGGTLGGEVQLQSFPSMQHMYERHPSGFTAQPPTPAQQQQYMQQQQQQQAMYQQQQQGRPLSVGMHPHTSMYHQQQQPLQAQQSMYYAQQQQLQQTPPRGLQSVNSQHFYSPM